MKDVNINHTFTLSEILESIKDVCEYNGNYQKDRDRMIDKIDKYLEMIEE